MSRSGFSDECDDDLAAGRWLGALSKAINGARGQAFLKEVLAALDAMPEKALIAESLATADGEFCTLGVLGCARGLDMSKLDPDDWDSVAAAFKITPTLVREIVYNNDEGVSERGWVRLDGPADQWGREPEAYLPLPGVTERRWQYMRDWVAKRIKASGGAEAESHGGGNA